MRSLQQEVLHTPGDCQQNGQACRPYVVSFGNDIGKHWQEQLRNNMP